MKIKRYISIDEDQIYIILRIGLGVLFLWASLDKIIDPKGFSSVVKNYQILPAALIKPVALFLPWVEAFCGVMLVFGYLVKGSAIIITTLMFIFISSFVVNIFRGIDISCGCFSNTLESVKKTEYIYYIFRDILILVCGAWIFYYRLIIDHRR